MATFITRLEAGGDGPRLAVKDLIDVEGVPTTAGSRLVAERAEPAAADAPCLRGARAAGAAIVGKVNLHELAYGTTGVNPWFGTPRNPLDPALVPGGSSSGSAVAVAAGDADVALGTDTGGSVRIPAACCGVAGLKTTHGRVPLDGVWPLAPSLDTVGPLARDVAGLALGMRLLEPGFAASTDAPVVVGRVDLGGDPQLDPRIDAAVERALAAAELEVTVLELTGWAVGAEAGGVVLVAEAWAADRHLVEGRRDGADALSADVARHLALGQSVSAADVDTARAGCRAWRAALDEVFGRVQLLALPTLATYPPRLDATDGADLIRYTLAVNAAGLPAVAMPVPSEGRLPASLQLIGPPGSEEALLATAAVVEAAVG